jgi:hypothetical protein
MYLGAYADNGNSKFSETPVYINQKTWRHTPDDFQASSDGNFLLKHLNHVQNNSWNFTYTSQSGGAVG